MKSKMKLADGYPQWLERDQSAGHAVRTKERVTAVSVFTVNYIVSENRVFTELYQRYWDIRG